MTFAVLRSLVIPRFNTRSSENSASNIQILSTLPLITSGQDSAQNKPNEEEIRQLQNQRKFGESSDESDSDKENNPPNIPKSPDESNQQKTTDDDEDMDYEIESNSDDDTINDEPAYNNSFDNDSENDGDDDNNDSEYRTDDNNRHEGEPSNLISPKNGQEQTLSLTKENLSKMCEEDPEVKTVTYKSNFFTDILSAVFSSNNNRP